MARDESMLSKKKNRLVAFDEPIQKKKKKKKNREATKELQMEEQSNSQIQTDALSNCKRRGTLAEITATVPEEDELAEFTFKKKKKKKKSKLKEEGLLTEIDHEICIDKIAQECVYQNDEVYKSEGIKKKKSKKAKHVLALAEEEETEELREKHADKMSVKKKKRRSEAQAATPKLDTPPEPIIRDLEEVTKKKKKKKRREEEQIINPALTNNEAEEEECRLEEDLTSNSKKKRKKKRAHRDAEDVNMNEEDEPVNGDANETDTPKKKSMKRHVPECSFPKEKSKKKKKHSAVEQEGQSESMVSKGGVEVVSVKKGNADEETIDKDTKIGQWHTASFENPDQKMKFLRLMGGFKKSSPFTPFSPAGIEKPNVALNKTGEETLKQNLLSEFDKAMALKQNRGIGLGFQPSPKKTFFIDRNKSKSLKFDD
ncbi:lysine-rich nucleolar protein 1 isoform X2 [Ambystoma mexicanum]|uniref:lysine-rich nucleolar protein 1 isoform X2 n=1 Tax=Ambystoma mexicanum TaxID=8296 RepID=UPI0037E75DC7